jgi:PAS domain S-box-containing protein
MTGPLPLADRRRLPAAGSIVIFLVGYAAAYFYSAGFSGQARAPFWAPDAVLLCALLLNAPRRWWVYLLLALPVRLWLAAPGNAPLGLLVLDYVNEALEAIVTVSLLRRLKPKGSWLASVRDFARFGAIAVVAVPAASALAGIAIWQAYGRQPSPTWTEWFLGDALANLLLTPLILSFAAPSSVSFRSWWRRIETALLLAGLLVSGAMAFRGGGMSLPTAAVLLCIPFPFLLWTTIRLGARGTAGALSLLAVSGMWAAFHSPYHPGPGESRASVLSLQLFLFVVGSSLLFLAVVLEERRAIEENLRSTQARLARAEATSMLMVAHVGLYGRWLTVPRKLARLLGYARHELLNKTCNDVTYPEDRGPELREVQRLLAGEIPSFQLEKRFLKSDGTPVWFYLSRSVVRDPEGRPVHFLDYLGDIDELKRAEAAAARSENELRLFAEHSPAAVAVLDRELRFVAASRRFRDDFLSEDSPIVGRRYDEALLGLPRRWPEALQRSLEGVSEAGQDDTFTRPDGTIESLHWQIMPGPSSEGRPAGVFLFAELTTERKLGERTLEELRRELAHLMRVSVLGELSGAMAHEISQPLAAILANAQAAQSYLSRGPSGTNEVAAILEDIVADDLRAGEVIRSLRKMLRKGETELETVDINEVTREVLDLAQGDMITKNVSVFLRFAPDLPPVRADRVQLQQVLLNLIVNACEAMAAGTSPGRRLRIMTDLGKEETVHITIQDSGPGVPPEMRDRVFEPFLTTKSGGLGLGLTICRSIVMAHGGRLWHTGNETGGASFHLALPRAEAAG